MALFHRLTEDNSGSLALDRHLEELAFDIAVAVDRLANGVDDAAHQAFTHADGGDAFGALHRVALVDGTGLGQHHHADIVLLQVLDNALLAGGKLHQLARLCVVEAIDARNAVTHREDGAHLLQRHIQIDVGQLFLQNRRYFGRIYFYHICNVLVYF